MNKIYLFLREGFISKILNIYRLACQWKPTLQSASDTEVLFEIYFNSLWKLWCTFLDFKFVRNYLSIKIELGRFLENEIDKSSRRYNPHV